MKLRSNEFLVWLLVLVGITACSAPRVIALRGGESYAVSSLTCSKLKYSGTTVTVDNISVPSSIPNQSFSIGSVGIGQEQLQEATARVQELDQIQYRLCQNTLVLAAVSSDDQLVAQYLQASDDTFSDLVKGLRTLESAESEADFEEATDQISDSISTAKALELDDPDPKSE